MSFGKAQSSNSSFAYISAMCKNLYFVPCSVKPNCPLSSHQLGASQSYCSLEKLNRIVNYVPLCLSSESFVMMGFGFLSLRETPKFLPLPILKESLSL